MISKLSKCTIVNFILLSAVMLLTDAFLSPNTMRLQTIEATILKAEQDSLMEMLREAPPSEGTITGAESMSDAADSATTTIPAYVPDSVATIVDKSTEGSSIADLSTVALVAGQENYGLAVVLLGEAIWSFSKAPSVDYALKTLLPAMVAAVVLVAVSGPMITSEENGTVFMGLAIATTVSVGIGAVYVARVSAPYSPSPKEIPALGLLVAIAGFFSFSQNLVVDGFVTLPSIPSLSLPPIPTIELF